MIKKYRSAKLRRARFNCVCLFNLIISDRTVLSTSLEINVMTTHTDERSIISRAASTRDFCFEATSHLASPEPSKIMHGWQMRMRCVTRKDTCSVCLSRNSPVLFERPLAWTPCSCACYYIVSSIFGANHKSRGTILGANGASKNCADVRATGCATHEKSLLRTHQRSPVQHT